MIGALQLPRVPRSAERGGELGAERSPVPFQIRGFVRKGGVGHSDDPIVVPHYATATSHQRAYPPERTITTKSSQ